MKQIFKYILLCTGGGSIGEPPVHVGQTFHNSQAGRQQPSADNGQRHRGIRGRERAKRDQSVGPVQEPYHSNRDGRRSGKLLRTSRIMEN